MIDRDTALEHLNTIGRLEGIETVSIMAALNRVLASDVIARHTQPPASMSAMDGYAVRGEGLKPGNSYSVIGESAAGHPFSGTVGGAEAVRIFTGSVVPEGADHVVIQEDVRRDSDAITICEGVGKSTHIRQAGIDFKEGQVLLKSGVQLQPRHLSIIAASNNPSVDVIRRPRVAILSNGDELRPPGSQLRSGEIIASNEYTLAALISAWGGEPINLGIAPDDPSRIRNMIADAEGVNVFLPVGGASVGDHDHMKPVFADLGFESVFSKVAIKPGKPTWFSKQGQVSVLGLPGNPASALVCAHLFLRPLLSSYLGLDDTRQWCAARLTRPLSANGRRENFLRGRLRYQPDGTIEVDPAVNQDSSLLSPFIDADVLVQRRADAPAAEAGSMVDCMRLN